MSDPATPEYVSYDEADARLGGALTSAFDGGYATVLLFDGDLTVARAVEVVVVTGNLTVTGRVGFHDSLPGLYVGGRTEAETLEAGDAEVHIHDGAFTYLVHGYHNDGTLRAGTVDTPWVIEHEHMMRVDAPGALWVDEYGDAGHADFAGVGIAAAFVPEVVDEYVELRIDAFLDRLRAGLPVLRPGAREAAEAARGDAPRGRADGVEHLDLSRRGLGRFPAEVLGLPWLRTLILDDNPIGALPEELGMLTRLEQLSVRRCGLQVLPAAIGDLPRLRVLRLGGNAFDAPRAAHPTARIDFGP